MTENLEKHIEFFLSFLAGCGKAETTVISRRSSLKRFLDFCDHHDLTSVQNVTPAFLDKYLVYLRALPGQSGPNISNSRLRNHIIALKMFFTYLYTHGRIIINPGKEIQIPRHEKSLPKAVLTVKEIERLLSTPDINTHRGLRDRAMLETFYATGIRQAELLSLDVFDINLEKRTLFVRKGKGRRDRLLPIGKRAVKWLEKYLSIRYRFLRFVASDAIFLDSYGKRMSLHLLNRTFYACKKKAGIEKPGGFHLFRHSMATHMVERGADIRYVQEMLGHENIATTEIYTKVAILHLQQTYREFSGALYAV